MLHHRKNPRASWYDYWGKWVYFVTICTQDRQHYFGQIADEKMIYSTVGTICKEEIEQTNIIRPSVDIHEYVIMPNHIHLLISVRTGGVRTGGNLSNNTNIGCPTELPLGHRKRMSLQSTYYNPTAVSIYLFLLALWLKSQRSSISSVSCEHENRQQPIISHKNYASL